MRTDQLSILKRNLIADLDSHLIEYPDKKEWVIAKKKEIEYYYKQVSGKKK